MLVGLATPVTVRNVLGLAALGLGGVLLGLLFFQWLKAWVRSTQEEPTAGRGDWENALAGYKNLREQGVLSEDEYRKIRTLVEPHLHVGQSGGLPSGRPGPRESVAPGDVGGTPPTAR